MGVAKEMKSCGPYEILTIKTLVIESGSIKRHKILVPSMQSHVAPYVTIALE